jgi:hypothetical protein
LAQHNSLSLDTTDAPSENAEAVDHCRMRIWKEMKKLNIYGNKTQNYVRGQLYFLWSE